MSGLVAATPANAYISHAASAQRTRKSEADATMSGCSANGRSLIRRLLGPATCVFTLLLSAHPASHTDQLIEQLSSDEEAVRTATIQKIASMGADAVGLLVAVLEDERSSREALILAARELGSIGNAARSAAPALVARLNDETDEEVRDMCAFALGEIGVCSPQVVHSLIDALDGPQRLRTTAAEVLARVAAQAKKQRQSDALPYLKSAVKSVEEAGEFPNKEIILGQIRDSVAGLPSPTTRWWYFAGLLAVLAVAVFSRRLILYARRRTSTAEEYRSSLEPAQSTEVVMQSQFIHGHALVIGVANYRSVRKLPEAVLNDAKDVANLLQHGFYCGYPAKNVKLLRDQEATAAGIREGLEQLATTGPDDTVMVFFSGHGAQVESGCNKGTYLMPFDCDPHRLRESALSTEELTDLLSKIGAQRLVVFLDACHSGGTGDLKAVEPVPEFKAGLDDKALDDLAQGAGRVIVASSGADEVSLVRSGARNSVFTDYLLKALKGDAPTEGDGKIRILDVFRYLSDRVPADVPTQQPLLKAKLKTNFPLALWRGGKSAVATPETAAIPQETARGRARVEICWGLVDNWQDLANYYEIPQADQARFPKGDEPKKILEYLERVKKLHTLKDALEFLGHEHLARLAEELGKPR